jgi:hypothetical protein
MRFLRWNRTRPLASLVALVVWTAAMHVSMTLDGAMIGITPMWALLLPAALAYIAQRAGRATALLCAALGISLWGQRLGLPAAALAALILLPAPAWAVYCDERKAPFWQSIGVCAGLLLLGGMAALAAANALAGGDVVAAMLRNLEALLQTGPENDSWLLMMAGTGLVRVPDTVLGSQLGGALVLSDAVREELIKQVLFTAEAWLRETTSGQILQGALLGGVLCVAWPRRWVARHATEADQPLAPRVAFHQWCLPPAVTRPLILTLLGAWLLTFLTGAPPLIRLFSVLWAGVSLVLALQGGALLAFLMRKSGARPGARVVVVCVVFVLFQFALILLGCADQLFNPRMLRSASPKRHDEEDER